MNIKHLLGILLSFMTVMAWANSSQIPGYLVGVWVPETATNNQGDMAGYPLAFYLDADGVGAAGEQVTPIML